MRYFYQIDTSTVTSGEVEAETEADAMDQAAQLNGFPTAAALIAHHGEDLVVFVVEPRYETRSPG